MNCSISGEVPEEPVVSAKSGLLFEKRLIERHISDYGKCPITGEPLTMDDIVPIKSGKIVRPRPLQAASIPGMLGMFQTEWDGLMLSNFALEQQLHTARQELSHALYQHDAACRVIARLKKERDDARSLLAQADRHIPMTTSGPVQVNASSVSNGRPASGEEVGPDGKRAHPGISPTVFEELTECNAALSQQRKKRQIPSTLASVDDLERYTQISSHPLHKTSKPGIISVDIHPSKDVIATGGLDTNSVIFDRSSGEILSTLSGHSKKVTCVKFASRDDLFLSGSADKTVRIWQGSDDGYTCKHVLKDHNAEVQAVTVHATNNYFVTASLDNTWCFYDLSSGTCLTQVEDTSETDGYTSAAFHPDGLILGTGTSQSIVKIWDVKSQTNVARFDGHVGGAVTAISFSENGYFLATAASDGVKLWDLRKLKNFRTFSPYGSDAPTSSVEFDHSGSYLALAGSDIRVYQVANVKSEWNCIKTLPDLSGTGKVTCVKFGPDAKYLAVGSMDRNLRVFGLPGDNNNGEEMES